MSATAVGVFLAGWLLWHNVGVEKGISNGIREERREREENQRKIDALVRPR